MKRLREDRPGVEAAQAAHRGQESEVRYRVVTARSYTYHETFDEALAEYQLRRAMDCALTPTRGRVVEDRG